MHLIQWEAINDIWYSQITVETAQERQLTWSFLLKATGQKKMALSERLIEDMPEMMCHGSLFLELHRGSGKAIRVGKNKHDSVKQETVMGT